MGIPLTQYVEWDKEDDRQPSFGTIVSTIKERTIVEGETEGDDVVVTPGDKEALISGSVRDVEKVRQIIRDLGLKLLERPA